MSIFFTSVEYESRTHIRSLRWPRSSDSLCSVPMYM